MGSYKNIYKILSVIGLLLFLTGCSDKKDTSVFDIEATSEANIGIDSLHLIAIDLEDIVSSYEVESGLKGDMIYVVDKYLCTLNFFDENGKLKSSHLGEGRAANETVIGQISGAAFMENVELVIFNPSGIYMIYDKDLLLDRFFQIEYNKNNSQGGVYDDPMNYTHRYNRLAMHPHDGKIYFNMELALPDANIVESGEKYLTDAYAIAELDIDANEYTSLLGKGYPHSYRDNPAKKRILSASYFDIDKQGHIYATYETDSTVYVFDKYENGISAFGRAGKDMNLDYVAVSNLKDARKHYGEERRGKGYYNWIEYVDDTDVLFRSYQKGGDSHDDGLQIYKDGVLVGDVDVPKGFKVAGYSAPYYYSKVIADEDNEKLKAYKFRIDYNNDINK